MIVIDTLPARGDAIGSMHGHEPWNHTNPLNGFKPVAIIEIDDDQAPLIARSIGRSAVEIKSDNKTGYLVAANEDQAIVIYHHDSGFFLTTLTR